MSSADRRSLFNLSELAAHQFSCKSEQNWDSLAKNKIIAGVEIPYHGSSKKPENPKIVVLRLGVRNVHRLYYVGINQNFEKLHFFSFLTLILALFLMNFEH